MAEYNVKASPYNAKGDGTTDDTSAIQSCFNACSSNGDGYVYIPSGTYMINAITSLQVPSNIKIVFNSKATLKAITTNANTSCVLMINNVSNVDIDGSFATVMGDRDTNTYVGGEYGMCVKIVDATNVTIRNLIATKGYGDGFYVGSGSNGFSENIQLLNCISDSNRRNGLSVTSAKNLLVQGGEYKNTNGTNPQFGIDVEPNSGSTIENVLIKGVKTSNNLEGGIALIPINMKGSTNNFDVTVEDWLSEGDGLPASTTYGIGLLLDNDSSTNAQVYGDIEINKATIIGPDAMGVYVQGWCDAPKAILKDVIVYNPNTYVSTYNLEQAAFGMDYNSGDPTNVNFGNITFERCGVVDNRATKVTKYAFAFTSSTDRPFNNIKIIDPVYDGITSTWLSWSVPNTNSGMVAKFNTPTPVNLGTSQAITNYAGQDILATAACTLTLPSANTVQGAEYLVRYGAASGTVTLAANTGDTIINKGASVTSVALTLAGTFIKVRSIGSNKWAVVEQNIS